MLCDLINRTYAEPLSRDACMRGLTAQGGYTMASGAWGRGVKDEGWMVRVTRHEWRVEDARAVREARGGWKMQGR